MGDPAGERLQVVHRHVRHVNGRRRRALALPQHRRGAARHGIGNEAAAVGARARIGDEDVAGRYRARVGAQIPRRHAQPLQFIEHALCFLRFTFHRLSGTAAASRATCTGFNGASGATPSVRRLPAITWANTGAATSPP
jgi:hypothetical protein